ncbi:MAG: PAS domain S-box protein [Anaerolineales bacterium]|nr:PAS domain S-box protein [Anaerolineales bacterium]
MQMQFASILLPLFMAAAISIILTLLAWQRRYLPAATAFALLMAAMSVWSLCSAFELAGSTLASKMLWLRMQYLGIAAVPMMWLLLALDYTGRKRWLTPRSIAVLAIEPFVMLLLVWTNDAHQLIWRDVSFADAAAPLNNTFGIGFWINMAYSYVLLFIGVVLMIQDLARSPNIQRGQTLTLLIGLLIPWLGNALYLVGPNPFQGLDLTPFAFALSGVVISWGLLRHRLLEIAPIARKLVIENIGDAVIILDVENRVVDINPAAQQIVGRPAADIIGKQIAGIFPGLAELAERCRAAIETSTEINLATGETGTGRDFDLRISPLFIHEGQSSGCLIVLHDITGRKQAEHALRESEGKYRSLVEQSLQGIIVAEGSPPRIVFINRAMTEILGYSAEELLAMSSQEVVKLVHPEDRGVFFQRYQARLSGEQAPPRYELRSVRKDGAFGWVEMFSSRIEYLGKPAVQAAFVDITERKRAEEALRRRNRELVTLYDTAIAVSSPLALDAVLQTVAEQMTRALDISACALSLLKREQNLVTTLVDFSIRFPDRIESRGVSYDLADYPVTRRVLETGEPIVIHRGDPAADEAEVALLEQWQAHSLLMLPLCVGDRVMGLVELIDEVKRRDFTAEEIRLASSLALQAAVAIDKARLFEQAQQEITERKRAEEAERELRQLSEALRDTTAALNSTLNLGEVLDLLLANLERVLPHDAANVMLAEGGVGRVVGRRGYTSRGQDEAVLAVRYNLADVANLRQMAETGRPLVIPDTSAYPGWVLTEQTRWIRSYLGTPILSGEQVIGFLNLDASSPGFFTEMHGGRLQAFADAASIAIRNAQLYEEVQRYAAQLEQRVAERTTELQAANERLQALSQVKDDFVANVSHELRTPITNIKLYHDLLKYDHNKIDAYLAVLNRETARLSDVIEALLQLSRLDQGRVATHLAPTDLNELARLYTSDRMALAELKGIALTLEQEASLPPVQADPKLLGQALSVLLTNALNYTPAGGSVLVKTCSSRFEGRRWAGISVIDDGPGIPPAERPRLFERFFRGVVGRESGAPGTGLGLAIAREIVARHAGRIEVESSGVPGQGADFSIWLPAGDWTYTFLIST